MSRTFRTVTRAAAAAAAAVTVTALAAAPATAAPAPAWRVAHGDRAGSTQATSVAAVTASDVWAGTLDRYDLDEGAGVPSVTHWDGHTWRRYPVGTGDESGEVDVAARAGDDAYAAWFGDEGARVQHWDGHAWHAVGTSGLAPYRGGLAVTPHRVWALGTFHSAAVRDDHGGGWVRSRAIETGKLYDIAARTKNDVWVVGDSHEDPRGPSTWDPVAAHWDGTRWTRTKLPVSGCDLRSVTTPAAGDAWTVCVHGIGVRPSVLRWQDGAWHVVGAATTPVLGTTVLPRITASPGGRAWFVNRDDGVAAWTGTAWTTARLPKPGGLRFPAALGVAWIPGTTAGAYAAGYAYGPNDGGDYPPTAAILWRTRA